MPDGRFHSIEAYYDGHQWGEVAERSVEDILKQPPPDLQQFGSDESEEVTTTPTTTESRDITPMLLFVWSNGVNAAVIATLESVHMVWPETFNGTQLGSYAIPLGLVSIMGASYYTKQKRKT